MALSRRSNRFQASIWPGFVDAMTGLLLVLFFVLTIFMVVQSILSETIKGQDDALDQLGGELDLLTSALGLERERSAGLEDQVGQLDSDLATATSRIAEAEANLLDAAAREAALTERLTEARDEIDAGTEAARLAAARREALEALLAETRANLDQSQADRDSLQDQLSSAQVEIDEAEAARLVDRAAAEALRERLSQADSELTAMSLALEEERKRAEETLTLLAAAQTAQEDLNSKLAAALTDADLAGELSEERDRLAAQARDSAAELASALAAKRLAEATAETALNEAEQRQVLLSAARQALSDAEDDRDAMSSEAEEQAKRLALTNAQLADLRGQLASLRASLDSAEDREEAQDVELEALGDQLSTALARATLAERRRAALEEAERIRLEEEAKRLERYQSEFFGRVRDAIGEQQGVRIVGDRFVFDSEVLFAVGQAELSEAGQEEIAKVALLLQEVAAVIPDGIDWIVRVDGHTDNLPVTSGRFQDNWALSQERALSVVRYMIDDFGFPPDRLAATGFGEFQPVDPANTPEARAKNRRIELKLTER